MMKGWLAALAAGVALLVHAGIAAASEKELTIVMDDGVELAATLHLPSGEPPKGGWPAIVFLHGLGGKRQDIQLLAKSYRLAGDDYVMLSVDARGHGESEGRVSVDGPREIADTRRVFEWLRGRSDVAGAQIGGWGISYGGGAILNSLVAGVPWAAVEVVETWSDLYSALAPQHLVKSGLVAGLAASVPASRRSPDLDAMQAAALSGTGSRELADWARARSSIQGLGKVRTPVFLMQGRRDFLFPIDQASRAFTRLKGPKRLWIGNHGHLPSSFPGADTIAMFADGRAWFDRFLRGKANGVDRRPPVVLADEGRPSTRSFRDLPDTRVVTTNWQKVGKTIEQGGKVTLHSAELSRPAEVFGSPAVTVVARPMGGWSRIVAVLVARTKDGKEIVVAAGGVPTRPGKRSYRIQLLDQATKVPKAARYEVILSSSTVAQSPGNLLYLDLPMPETARLELNRVELRVPVLR